MSKVDKVLPASGIVLRSEGIHSCKVFRTVPIRKELAVAMGDDER